MFMLKHPQSLIFLFILFLMMGYGVYRQISGNALHKRKLESEKTVAKGIGETVRYGLTRIALTWVQITDILAAFSLAGIAS